MIRWGRRVSVPTDLLRRAVHTLTESLQAPKEKQENRLEVLDQRCGQLGITPRQQEIILMMGDGLQHKEIASELNLSERSVARHIQNLYNRLEVHNKVELMNLLFRV